MVDDNRDKTFLAAITKQFRGLGQGLNPPRFLVGKVVFRDSASEELIQLADMICGAVCAKLDGESTWYDMIAERDAGLIGPKKCQKGGV